MIYKYITHVSNFPEQVEADTDEAAIMKVQEKEGKYMIGVKFIYTDDVANSTRTIYME